MYCVIVSSRTHQQKPDLIMGAFCLQALAAVFFMVNLGWVP